MRSVVIAAFLTASAFANARVPSDAASPLNPLQQQRHGRTGEANSAIGVSVTIAEPDSAITVALVQPATEMTPGVVSVSVPPAIVAAGEGFSFPLPEALTTAARTADVHVTLMNGNRLPSWLHYEVGTSTFTAATLPKGALPMKLLGRIGTQRWTVQISERADR